MNKKNRQQPQGEMQPLQIPEQPCVSYHVDFLTDLPPATEAKFDMLMVVVDRHRQSRSDSVERGRCSENDGELMASSKALLKRTM